MRDDSFKIFKRFDKVHPGHSLRYSYSTTSKPLFYSDYDQFEPVCKTKCQECGSARIFELQLNAQILCHIKPLIELDWGIIGVYTCSKSCQGKEKYVREFALLQLAPEDIDKLNMRRMNERKMREFQADMEDDGPEIPMEEEIAKIEKQIKEEEKLDKQRAKDEELLKKAAKKKKEETIEEAKPAKDKKLFDSADEDEEDAWK